MLEGEKLGEPCGEYDICVTFATRLNWTPDMVHELDPHFVDELLARWSAEGDIAEKQRKESEKQRAKNEAKRRR